MDHRKFILQMRKAGAQRVNVRILSDGAADIEVEWPTIGPCEREHADVGEISEEEWQRRHAWAETLGEYSLEDGKDMFEELGRLRHMMDYYKKAAQNLDEILRDKLGPPRTDDLPDTPSDDEEILEDPSRIDLEREKRRLGDDSDDGATERLDDMPGSGHPPASDDAFDSWFEATPIPPHFKR